MSEIYGWNVKQRRAREAEARTAAARDAINAENLSRWADDMNTHARAMRGWLAEIRAWCATERTRAAREYLKRARAQVKSAADAAFVAKQEATQARRDARRSAAKVAGFNDLALRRARKFNERAAARLETDAQSCAGGMARGLAA